MKIESQISILEVEISKIKTNHALHFIISLVFVGLWLPMWAMIAISNASVKKKKTKELYELYKHVD